MTRSATHDFTMDPNLLTLAIKSQSGSLAKALLEGIMNSIDAGASRVDVFLGPSRFAIRDDGRGFTSEEEVRQWFGRFGTPHQKGDALYGRFRMGRGQLMAYAATNWRSGPFHMTVDIERFGLTYELARPRRPIAGCTIEGVLYRRLRNFELTTALAELKKLVAFTPKPVYVNDELYGASPARLGTWTLEDDLAYYRVVPGANVLEVYNQGVFVRDFGTWQVGCGGVVVSKQALEVNLARNALLEAQCPVWSRIRKALEALVIRELATARQLSDSQRKFLAIRFRSLARWAREPTFWKAVKLLTDPSGRHLPLAALANYTRFVHIPEPGALACAAHDTDGTFVVTDALLDRFGMDSLRPWLALLAESDLLPQGYSIIESESLEHLDLAGAHTLDQSGLSGEDRAAFKALTSLNEILAAQLIAMGVISRPRPLLLGRHNTGRLRAWTDGRSFITANVASLRNIQEGMDGILDWLHVLIHEYTHDSDDSESHSHGEVFYRKYHDTVTAERGLRLASLARKGLEAYVDELHKLGVPCPGPLQREARGLDP